MFSIPTVAQTQPGATGGTIGKQGKSVSGGEETGELPARREPLHPQRGRSHDREGIAADAAVAGRWRWQGECGIGGRYQGSFEIGKLKGGRFSGTLVINGDQTTGSISGRVSGDSISFDNTHLGALKWSGTLNGGHISGSFSNSIGYVCQWTASR
jgi:hypothetical protein